MLVIISLYWQQNDIDLSELYPNIRPRANLVRDLKGLDHELIIVIISTLVVKDSHTFESSRGAISANRL
ncbi:hypothetical protein BpHYR1_039141 [Brachionus plicatilis]|uniref:Uncharacterized protein n=1 Tax=Brachionus plicatilis TaxID=10195 RepID=A0A3M7PMA5_BRAPC|nr:hypothetical protein BpHYR1_039141 [Brachionus plicatilis]